MVQRQTLVGTHGPLAGWIAAGIHRWSAIAALDTSIQPTPSPRCAGTEGVSTPFFSPDGEHVGFLEDEKLQIASVNGGPPIYVTDSLTGVAGASWGPDNFIYADGFGRRRSPPRRGEAGGNAAIGLRCWTQRLERSITQWPDVLPNGKGVLFTVRFSGRNGVKGGTSYAIAVADIPSGKHRVILDDAMYARYATPGYLLYVTTNKTLMAVPFDQNSMKIVGEPTALTEGMRLGLTGARRTSRSQANGTLVYATGAGEGKQELVWVTRDGKEQAVDPDWPGAYLGLPIALAGWETGRRSRGSSMTSRHAVSGSSDWTEARASN